MKKQVKKFRKSKVFNSVNIILVALILVEVVFVINEGVFTGNPVKSVSLAGEDLRTPSCIPSPEICDGKDNDCDGDVDEEGVCEYEGPEFNGYIIQLKDEPASKVYAREINSVEKGLLTKQALKEKVDSYRKGLIEKQTSLAAKVKALYPKVKITSKFQNVFNGFAVSDITEADAKKLEAFPEVGEVHRNYKTYPTLMDSVPLINADDVWLLDADGNSCLTSGKECLTGKGVSIGIIDTGVDYSHPDLGASVLPPERALSRINSAPITNLYSFKPWAIDQQFRIKGDKLVYYSIAYSTSDKIYVYSFDTSQTVIIDTLPPNVDIVRLAFDGNLIAYFGADSETLDMNLYLYDLTSGENIVISNFGAGVIKDVGFVDISNNKVVYSAAFYIYENNDYSFLKSGIFVYDILTGQTTVLWEQNEMGDGFYMPLSAVSGDLAAAAIWQSRNVCPENITIFNIGTGESYTIYPPDYGAVLDMKGEEILYSDCSRTTFDPQGRHYHLYNIITGESVPLFYSGGNTGAEASVLDWAKIYSYTIKGSIGEGVVFFSEGYDSNRIVAYDLLLGTYNVINLYKLAGDLDSEDTKVCFLAPDPSNYFNLDIYCHDYDPSNDYTAPESAFNSKVVGGYDFSDNDHDPLDYYGHGTHVAATAAGNGVLKGVAPDATIYALKVFPNSYDDVIIRAINYSIDPNGDGDFSDHLDIISMSLGGYGNPDDPMSQAVDNAVDLGVVAVIAAGNSGPSGDLRCRNFDADSSGNSYSICSPGTARKAITLAASNKSDVIAGFSSRGPANGNVLKPDITAPGISICAARFDSYAGTCLDSLHTSISGTSMATPHVSGAVALIKQAHPDWTPSKIKYALKNSAARLGEHVYVQGAGRLDAYSAAITGDFSTFAELMDVPRGYDGTVGGNIDIRADIQGSDFASLELVYIPASEYGISSGTLIAASNSLPAEEVIVDDFDTREFPEGELVFLKLTVTDAQGNSGSDMLLLNIRNAPKIDLKSGTSASSLVTRDFIEVLPEETAYFQAIATGFSQSEGVCASCSYAWYKDGVIQTETSNLFSTSFHSYPHNHNVKVVVTDNSNQMQNEKEVVVVSGTIAPLVSLPGSQEFPDAWGNYVVWTDASNGDDVYLFDLSTRTLTQLTNLPSQQDQPAIHGNRVVWRDYTAGRGNYDIYMYDIPSGTTTQITLNPDAQVNPDIYGDIIVWEDWRNDRGDIYMYNISTGVETRITQEEGQFLPKIYENFIVWQDRREGSYGREQDDIYLYDLQAQTLTRLTLDELEQQVNPDINGNWVVWEDYRDFSARIYAYNIATGTESRISNSHSLFPRVHDGVAVWQDYRNRNSDIYAHDLSTGEETAVTVNDAHQYTPAVFDRKVFWYDFRPANYDIFMADLSPFICADINHDNVRDVIDVVKLVDYAFRNGAEPQPKWIGDLNGDNVTDVIDVVKLVDYAFRGGEEPTCTAQQNFTSSSATASLGSATGTSTAKTVSVNLANTENVAGTTFKLNYDANKLYVKSIRTASRTSNMQLIINGNEFTFIKQDGSQTIAKGSGPIAYIDVTSGKSGFDTSSLKIAEVKAANPEANKISVKIGSSTGVKSGTTLS